MSFADWIAIDWGDSSLRLWAMGHDGPLGEIAADKGILATPAPEPLILKLAGPWLAPDRVTEVVICGGAGALGGWVEAGYRQVPCAPIGPGGSVKAPTADPRLSVRILPGLSQAAPPAVLRGEETQLAGFLAAEPGFDGVVCLPGPHSKWIHVSAGEAVSFVSFMTGAIFELLSEQSILRQTVAHDGYDATAFLASVSEALSRPAQLAAGLFPLWAEAIMSGLDPVVARSRLSGLLVGAELAGARRYWLGRDVVVIGPQALSALYVAALEGQGVAARISDGRTATLAGLAAAHAIWAD